ncbi:SRPBCC family protein [Pseudonocardia nigra]|uniref:SRPBCC family protein n=1 Tax=Pseudonocardia nigra TaxID=1921578 RepID=UPI001C5FDFDB|nr:SRPBCC family protein [Pseudonocardia nigra]
MSQGRTDRGATGLALFSLGLGSAQVGAPGAVARLVGADDGPTSRAVVRWACGVRELAAGLGAGTSSAPGRWIWARAAGDLVDLALLGTVLTRHPGRRARTLVAAAAVLGVTAADVATARRATRRPDVRSDRLDAQASVTVNRPPGEVYAFWRDLQNLPRFMAHVEDVTTVGQGRSRWTATAPGGRQVTWEAEITDEVADELLAWRSLPGADVPTSGHVRFRPAPGDRGTEVHVRLDYAPPAGRLGAAVATLFGENPRQQVRDDLRRFKQVMETGDIVRTESSPEGTVAARTLRRRPARPEPST